MFISKLLASIAIITVVSLPCGTAVKAAESTFVAFKCGRASGTFAEGDPCEPKSLQALHELQSGETERRFRLVPRGAIVNFLELKTFPAPHENVSGKTVKVPALKSAAQKVGVKLRTSRGFATSSTSEAVDCVQVYMVDEYVDTSPSADFPTWEKGSTVIRPIFFAFPHCNAQVARDGHSLVTVYEVLVSIKTFYDKYGYFPASPVEGVVVNGLGLDETGFHSSVDWENSEAITLQIHDPPQAVTYINNGSDCTITTEIEGVSFGVGPGVVSFDCDYLTAQYCQ